MGREHASGLLDISINPISMISDELTPQCPRIIPLLQKMPRHQYYSHYEDSLRQQKKVLPGIEPGLPEDAEDEYQNPRC